MQGDAKKITEAADGEIVRLDRPTTLFKGVPLIWVGSLPADLPTFTLPCEWMKVVLGDGADEPTIVE